MGNRILEHPILELKREEKEKITFYYNGAPVKAYRGDTIAAALTAEGIRIFRYTAKYHEPRGLFCAIGQCTDCAMEVDGVPNVRTCVTLVEENMHVNTQRGLGGENNGAI